MPIALRPIIESYAQTGLHRVVIALVLGVADAHGAGKAVASKAVERRGRSCALAEPTIRLHDVRINRVRQGVKGRGVHLRRGQRSLVQAVRVQRRLAAVEI